MIRCLIVDDEEPARELIKLHLSHLEDFEVVASVSNALDAFVFLQKNPVDLVFLDIRMPKVSGLELLRCLKWSPKIILTTAYREYAAEAFDLEVFDYLVKPVTQGRFMKAIARFMHYRSSQAGAHKTAKSNDGAYMFFKVGREQVKILLDDILYIEGLADYIKVHTAVEGIYFHRSFRKPVEPLLPPNSQKLPEASVHLMAPFLLPGLFVDAAIPFMPNTLLTPTALSPFIQVH